MRCLPGLMRSKDESESALRHQRIEIETGSLLANGERVAGTHERVEQLPHVADDFATPDSVRREVRGYFRARAVHAEQLDIADEMARAGMRVFRVRSFL